MVTPKQTQRTSPNIESKRWAAYAAAGAAAIAAGASDAQAGITLVSPAADLVDNAVDGSLGSNSFVLTGGANLVFNVGFGETGPGEGQLAMAFNSFAGTTSGDGYFYPSNLPYGANISAQTFQPTGNRGDLAWGDGFNNSQFIDTGGYVGFQFDVGGGTQYGWAELTLLSGAPANQFRLENYAFAGPGESILAGVVPEPSSLAFLALGAVGVTSWRSRRSASSK